MLCFKHIDMDAVFHFFKKKLASHVYVSCREIII